MDAEPDFTLRPLKTGIVLALIGAAVGVAFDWLTHHPTIEAAIGILVGAMGILVVVRTVNRQPPPPSDAP